MGNVAMVCGGRPGGSTEPVEPRSPVTVLQSNGNVLSLYGSRIRVVDLILDYPNHFVCHSSSLVLLHHSKILPLHTLLVPGEVYFLLPMPSNRPHHQDNESDTSSLLHIEPPRRASTGSSTKFVISTEQFSRIMAGSLVKDGKGGSSASSSSSGKRNRHHGRSGSSSSKTTTAMKGSSSSNSITAPIAAPWRPALSSIEEVAAN